MPILAPTVPSSSNRREQDQLMLRSMHSDVIDHTPQSGHISGVSWLEIYANLQSPKTLKSISDKVPYRFVTILEKFGYSVLENLTEMQR
ncbi:hypothetical protein TNCV_2521211 [Trichonephila clavipes]|nr:hypothetical protein TNCV_2521211 [Trichonephila clavipes]